MQRKGRISFSQFIFLSGSTLISFGLLAIFGWMSNLYIYVSKKVGYIPMAPDTAILFIFTGTVFILETKNMIRQKLRKFLLILICFFTVYGFLKFTGGILQIDFTLENRLFPVTDRLGYFPLMRMSPISGLLFFIAGMAMFLKFIVLDTSRYKNMISVLGVLVSIVGFTAVLGYLFGSPLLYGGRIIPLALSTAISFLLLGCGLVVMAGAGNVFLRRFTGETASAKLIRAIVPIIIMAIFLQGFLCTTIVRHLDINEALVSALLTLIFIIVTTIVVVNLSNIVFRGAHQAEMKRNLAEETLRVSLEKYRILIESFPLGITITEESGKIIEANKESERLLGILPHDHPKRSFISPDWKIIRTDGSPMPYEEYASYRALHEQRLVEDTEMGIVKDNGEIVWLSVTAAPIPVEGYGVAIAYGDITGRKIAEEALKQNEFLLKQQNEEYLAVNEELKETNERIFKINEELFDAKEKAEESDRLKSAFLANLSHEIRTPMNAIKGFAELLEKPNLPETKMVKYSRIINLRADDLLNLINDLLDLSIIEAGQLVIMEKRGSIDALFQEIHQFFDLAKEQQGRKMVSVECNNELGVVESMVFADFFRLRQIFINLINNALKFTGSGHVLFGCRLLDNETILYYVEDTGIGIPKDKQEIIFERFRQVNDSFLTKEKGGVGLGLSIVKALVNLMKGKIWLNSEPGQGATFCFSLPYVPANKTEELISMVPPHPYDWSNKTILIVEDDPFNAELIIELVKETKAKCKLAGDGRNTLDIINSVEGIDLILMDIQLPDINGYELTRRIKKIHPETIIIAQTAYATDDDKSRAFESGCDDYISKPIRQEKLLKLIQKYLK
jgi:PAS domain S-box-containing protein